MIVRIVKMVFREAEVPAFLELFEARRSLIRQFEGCTHLELWRDKFHPNTFFTYSWWDSEEYLEAYRNSRFFEDTWQLTKQKFAARAEAWTVERIDAAGMPGPQAN
ncbi:MAG TPA: antibiotic biosynthesis monooxygenase family protein [Flavisolibacter sp.]|nr:antibiotic biosynthesis monooxygenase family protein [Flavisolibacter sp.]